MGRMPNTSCSGRQVVPVRKSQALYFVKKGRPLANKNAQMTPTAKMQTHAEARNSPRMSPSERFFRCCISGYLLSASQLVTSPTKIWRTCSSSMSSMGLAGFTMIAMPSMASTVPAAPSAISESFKAREAMPMV